MKPVQVIRTVALGFSLTACGALGGMADSATTAAAPLMDSGATVLKQVRLVTGDFSAKNNSPECLALRGKVFGKRKEVQVSAEWGTIVNTPEFKTLDNHEKAFYSAGCKPEDSNATKDCAGQETQLEKDATALSQTAQWQTLENNERWTELQEIYTNAQKIDCLP